MCFFAAIGFMFFPSNLFLNYNLANKKCTVKFIVFGGVLQMVLKNSFPLSFKAQSCFCYHFSNLFQDVFNYLLWLLPLG